MANLNEDEKNTLAITRYWFENQKKVRALVTKLVKSFDDEDVTRLTGIPLGDIPSFVNTPKKFRTTTERMVEDFKNEDLAELVEPIETKVIDHLEEKKPAHNAKYTDIANGIIDLIDELNLDKGDRLPTSKQLAEKFGTSTQTITNAIAHLREKGVVNSARGQGITVA